MASETQSFLDAEESVNQLLKNLKKIKSEMEGYKNAKENLEAAAAQVVELASALNGTAELTADVVKKLGEIGTPEIMDAVNRLSEINDGVRHEIGELAGGIGSIAGGIGAIEGRLSDLGQKVEQVAVSVESLNTLEQKIAGSLKKQEDTIKKEIAKGNQESQSVITEMNKKVSGLSDDVSTSRLISIAIAVMIGILIIITLANSGSM